MNEHEAEIDKILDEAVTDMLIREIMRNIDKVLVRGGKEKLIAALADGMKPRV